MTPSPCRNCPRRYIACHARCDEYGEWLAIHETEKAAIKRKKVADADVSAFQAGLWKRRKNLPDNRFWKEEKQ